VAERRRCPFQSSRTGPGLGGGDRGHWHGLGGERCAWDAASGIVTIDTLESNLWGPGSGWRYEFVSAVEGTDLRVSLTRLANSFKGKLIAALIPIAGPRALGKQFQSVLRRAEGR